MDKESSVEQGREMDDEYGQYDENESIKENYPNETFQEPTRADPENCKSRTIKMTILLIPKLDKNKTTMKGNLMMRTMRVWCSPRVTFYAMYKKKPESQQAGFSR